MSTVLILYFSGVGNTKAVAEAMGKCMAGKAEADIYSVEKLPEGVTLDSYSGVIIGFPTYHSEPALPIMEFIKQMQPDREIPAFIFTTCGLYSENSLRIFARECVKRNIIPVGHASYRCAATDGILFTPGMKIWHKNEKNIHDRVKKDVDMFIRRLESDPKPDMPGFKWYAPLNYPNKILGKAVTFPIFLHKGRCIRCGKCANNCPRNAVDIIDGYPAVSKEKCINCYRCIHRCPALALSLSKNKSVKKVWSSTM